MLLASAFSPKTFLIHAHSRLSGSPVFQRLLTVVAVAALALCFFIFQASLSSHVRDVRLIEDSGEQKPVVLPFEGITPAPGHEHVFEFMLWHSPKSPAVYVFNARECLLRLTVNGAEVKELTGSCKPENFSSLDLSTYLVPGKNTVAATVYEKDGRYAFHWFKQNALNSLSPYLGWLLALAWSCLALCALTTRNSRHRNLYVFASLVLLAAICRLPQAFISLDIQNPHLRVSHDEITFLAVAQEYFFGRLPLVEAWDIKPPLLYTVSAWLMLLANLELMRFRLFAGVYLAISATIVYFAHRPQGERIAFIGSLVMVVFYSCILNGRSFMADHATSLPLALAYYLWMRDNTCNRLRYFLIGIFIGIAAMMLTTMAILILAPAFWLIWRYLKKNIGWRECLVNVAFLAAGTLLPFGVIFTIYAMDGHGKLLWNTLFTVAVDYSSILKSEPINVLRIQQRRAIEYGIHMWTGNLWFFAAVISSWPFFLMIKKKTDITVKLSFLIFFAFLAVVLRSHYPAKHTEHYLMVLIIPVVGMFCMMCEALWQRWGAAVFPLALCCLGAGAVPLVSQLREDYDVMTMEAQQGRLLADDFYRFASTIRMLNHSGQTPKVFGCMLGETVNVLLRAPVLNPMVHGTNIYNPAMLKAYYNGQTPSAVSIFEKAIAGADFVVTDKKYPMECNDMIAKDTQFQNYYETQNATLYVRRDFLKRR